MTPAGMVFTTLNAARRSGSSSEQDGPAAVARRILRERGVRGMYAGVCPMAARQATNWASRAGFTEIARSTLNLSQYGVPGEIGSGILGGLVSCWNTPIEAVRLRTQSDVGAGRPPKTMTQYWREMVDADGYPGLFRGITPRALQAVWQTCFMVVVPNLMGM